jgi:hypothetical protein
MFTLVVYMKAVLMRRLRPLLETSKFLEFEWYLNRIRSKGWNRFDWQVGLAVPIVIGGVLVIWSIYNDIQRGTEGFWTFQNGIWLLIVLYQALMVVMKFIGVTYLQGRAMRKKRRPVRKKARAAVVSLTGE